MVQNGEEKEAGGGKQWWTPEDPWRAGMLFQNRKRSQLSNERTFLAWVRTSLALITLGFFVQRFEAFLASTGFVKESARLSSMVVWVPILFFVLGGIIMISGTVEYFRVRREILREKEKKDSRIRDAMVVLTLVFLLAVSVIFVISMP